METDDRSIFNAHELDEALSIQDIRLSVARKVVFDGSHRIGVLLMCPLFGQTNRSDFGLAEGSARNSGLIDGCRCHSSDFFSDENALKEATVSKLKAFVKLGDD
ncbi:Uncharacterised protein [Chlamydia trachomatis]|nr:Uncharacterised protein [Chlamydia trachomatis]